MAEFTPPLISGYVKLTKFNQIQIDRTYEQGFISLRVAEPSLGIPTARTLTEPGSAYYFPLVAIGDTYLASRKFSGNDSIMMRNRNIGINMSNPTFNVDISGNLRAIEGSVPTLSTAALVPPAGATTLSVSYPSGVNINSNLVVTGNIRVTNLTAENITVTKLLSALSAENINTYTTIFTLTGAAINTDISVTGNLTATNIRALSSITSPSITAGNLFVTDFNTNNMTVASALSVVNDIYVNNIFGRIALDPTSALVYNTQNQLTYSGSIDYTFFVHPSDKFSTDDPNLPRSPNGAYDTDEMWSDPGGFKPFFKSIQGILNYVKQSGVFGNNLNIRVFGDIVNNERRQVVGTGSVTPTDASGTYSSLHTRTGNLTSAFYSFEYLGANYPHLTAAGIKGGEFIWSFDGNPPYGDIYHLKIENINFNTLSIRGNQNIGSFRNRNTPNNQDIALFSGSGTVITPFYNRNGVAKDWYWDRKIFNMPPCNIAFRTYVWGGNPLSGSDILPIPVAQQRHQTFSAFASNWTEVKTNNFITNYPVYVDTPTTLQILLRDVCFEMDSNTYISKGFYAENGFFRPHCASFAILGTSMYTDGAISINSSLCKITNDIYYPTVDPYLLQLWDVATGGTAALRAYNVVREDGELFDSPNIFPQYGIAIIGNQMSDREKNPRTLLNFLPGQDENTRKEPTLVWNDGNKNTGLVTIRNAAEIRGITSSTRDRIYGFFSQQSSSWILDGGINTPSIVHMYNNAMMYTVPYWFRTNTLAMSTMNVEFNNSGPFPTNRRTFSRSNDSSSRFNLQFMQFEGAFSFFLYSNWGLRRWVLGQLSVQADFAVTPFASIDNEATSPGKLIDENYTYTSPSTVDLGGSLFSLGAFNVIQGGGNVLGNRSIRVCRPEQLPLITDSGFGGISDPYSGQFPFYRMEWYQPSLR